MSDRIQYHTACEEYTGSLSARVVAESRVASDRHHLGKLILRSFKEAPEFVLQIDGGTGESQTFAEALERSVRCATYLKNLGLKQQDLIYIVAKHHIYACIPQYAALYQGFIVALSDERTYIGDFVNSLSLMKPKVIFCDSNYKKYVEEAVGLAGVSPITVVFDEKEGDFHQFVIKNEGEVNVHDFRAADFSPDETIAYLLSTSGTTGVPKVSKLTHTIIFYGIMNNGVIHDKFPTPTVLAFIFSPMTWFATVMRAMACAMWRVTRVHSSKELTWEHACDLIKKYRPSFMTMTTALVVNLWGSAKPGQLDLSSFNCVVIDGSYVFPDLVTEIKSQYPALKIISGFGLTETCGKVMWTLGTLPEDMSLTPTPYVDQLQLVDIQTLEVITKPYTNGELWIRGPSVFKGYYKNPEDTVEALTEDGWLRTGDLMYKNENGCYLYVERLKMLMRYKVFAISPLEIETLLLKHPGILTVAVTGFYDKKLASDLPVACVVAKDGWKITAQDIKDMVKHSLADHKQLRGGVIFLKNLPVRPNAKIDRRKLVDLVKTTHRE